MDALEAWGGRFSSEGAETVLSRRVIRWSRGLAEDGAAARPSVLAREGAMVAVVVVVVVVVLVAAVVVVVVAVVWCGGSSTVD